MKQDNPYSYRNDHQVPAFDDKNPVLVFDGVCVLCSGGAAKLLQWDKKQKIRFATAQSSLGQGLLKHYGCDAVSFNTVLLIDEGRAYIKSDVYIQIARILGWPWKIFMALRVIPKPIRNRLYDFKAKNRYRWFGKAEYCVLMPPNDPRFLAR